MFGPRKNVLSASLFFLIMAFKMETSHNRGYILSTPDSLGSEGKMPSIMSTATLNYPHNMCRSAFDNSESF